jgi:hypothetical protein
VTQIIHPGAGVLFMKVGNHAQESFADIVARKSKEIDKAGFTMWGYGGNTCHPSSMVQPFARSFAERGEPIHLCMEEMPSKHFAEPLCAAESSADGLSWSRIPAEIEVRGSRYALIIKDLRVANFTLPLARTRIAVGPSNGKLGSRYVSGRVDKACLEVLDGPERENAEVEQSQRPISLVAELLVPYAVFLRHYR